MYDVTFCCLSGISSYKLLKNMRIDTGVILIYSDIPPILIINNQVLNMFKDTTIGKYICGEMLVSANMLKISFSSEE
jgi:hypothetical protein